MELQEYMDSADKYLKSAKKLASDKAVLGVIGVSIIGNFMGNNYVGDIGDFYRTVSNYDTAMHLLGGGTIAYCIDKISKEAGKKIPVTDLLKIMISIGIGWEIFETAIVHYGLFDAIPFIKIEASTTGLIPNTGVDLIADTVGTYAGALFSAGHCLEKNKIPSASQVCDPYQYKYVWSLP